MTVLGYKRIKFQRGRKEGKPLWKFFPGPLLTRSEEAPRTALKGHWSLPCPGCGWLNCYSEMGISWATGRPWFKGQNPA